ncbi:MAG: FKBP-type peptidyl-prolyl cis-trans isomerase [Gemmatimonadales bacterium]|nr:FKBP-type peptidyl-prolyl cis-trans isomerase [Gemmatimonadales bacterium]
MRVRQLLSPLVLAVAAACGGDAASPSAATPLESTTFATTLQVNLGASTRLPSGMYIRDITTGSGATAALNQQISVYYQGFLVNGTQFDARQSPAAPIQFTLSASNLIQGWVQGVPGMRVGGTRQLVIPASLAYGAAGNGPVPPNANLVFTVTLVSIP